MRKHLIRNIVVLTLVLMAALVFVPAPAALAWYPGQNPNGSGCDNGAIFAFQYATPLKNISHPSDTSIAGEVNLRWSAACGTNWSRAVSYWGYSVTNIWIEQNGVQLPAHNGVYPSFGQAPIGSNGNVYWSPMYNGVNIPTKACAIIIVGESEYQGCTIAG